jgi:predicted Zn-ribbon and HTH transcriptional regulator
VAEEKKEEQSLEAWLAEERKRLDEGFSFEPPPPPEDAPPAAAQDVLAELGLGAGVLAGVIAGHTNPVTFEGCSASTIAEALISHIPGGDTRVSVEETQEATVVTVLQSQEHRPQSFVPALTVTLIETDETLTVAMSGLSQDVKRGAIGAIGRGALRGGRRLLLRRRGLGGVFDAAGGLMQSIEDVSEDIQDLSLPRRVWAVIDRVGGAAEEAYLDERQRKRALRRKREEAERAWTHCEWCGRAYAKDKENIVQCPSCGAPRRPKPDWLE